MPAQVQPLWFPGSVVVSIRRWTIERQIWNKHGTVVGFWTVVRKVTGWRLAGIALLVESCGGCWWVHDSLVVTELEQSWGGLKASAAYYTRSPPLTWLSARRHESGSLYSSRARGRVNFVSKSNKMPRRYEILGRPGMHSSNLSALMPSDFASQFSSRLLITSYWPVFSGFFTIANHEARRIWSSLGAMAMESVYFSFPCDVVHTHLTFSENDS